MEIQKNHVEIDLYDIKKLFTLQNTNVGIINVQSLATDESGWADGTFHIFKYKNCAYLGIKDLHIRESFTTNAKLENMISFEFMLRGGSDMQLGGKSIFNNDMPRLYVTSHSKNSHQTRYHLAKEKYIGVGIWVSPKALDRLFKLAMVDFPPSVQEVLTASKNKVVTYPLTGTVRQIIECILVNSFKTSYSNQYLEAKTTELICHTLECMKSPELAYSNDNNLTTAKTTAMKKLLDKLDNNIDAEIRLDSLCAELAMSKGQLVRTFKSSYGMNLSEYLTQKRMERSRILIMEGRLSIMHVALEVGYKNQSSFGRAFKKYFGYSPTNDRAL
ncbi:MAG: AraC family transcriptional regulator [Paraglaciecola sp.]|uniref:helix-turn-helix domain-containing protein n=1 Tax=Paraglaciecola sp. TaxID=1920173 RepID=UPI00329864A2